MVVVYIIRVYFPKCGRIHVGKFLDGMDDFIVCGMDLKNVRDCLDIKPK